MKIACLKRRTLWILVGLCLGWYVAGLPLFGGMSVAGEPPVQEEHGSTTNDGHSDEVAGTQHGAVQYLVPDPNHKPAWLRPVLWTIGGLFVAAVLLGPISLRLRGPELPDPADLQGRDGGGD